MTQVDYDQLLARLQRILAVEGPSSGTDLARSLGVSQSVFSRLSRQMKADLLVVGRARSTRYAGRREIPGVGSTIPLFEIDENGATTKIALIHAVLEQRFYVESTVDHIESRFHDGLPFFLNDIRPMGYLGRRLSQRHPELSLPRDLRLWTADDNLRYLTRYGWDVPGNHVLGEDALDLYVAGEVESLSKSDRAHRYAELAEYTLAEGQVGSSAGGEQPKFLANVGPDAKGVLVKFSPPLGETVALRIADLLHCEHIAHEVLRAHGQPASTSQIVHGSDRVFLEVERFDRTPGGGRRGVISLWALDSEYVGDLQGWTRSTRALLSEHLITNASSEGAEWLELFGHLIANTDMHCGNLAFFMDGDRPRELTPTYDMLPMHYNPQHGNLPLALHQLPNPSVGHASAWASTAAAARDFWERVRIDREISPGFHEIAAHGLSVLDQWETKARRLPN